MEGNKEYYAFISYKREDEKWAKWIQHKLEHYRFPSNLNGKSDLPKNIRPTFRDVTGLNPGLLTEEVEKALRNSHWLIVVCSPRSAKSPWVCKEVQTFIDLGRADHIIPFVIEGTPFSADPAEECFPEAILKLTGSRELLAANINEMGRDAAVIKVISRMFGLRFDTLWQRYEKEKRRRRNIIIAAVIAFIIAVLCVTGHILLLNRQLEREKSEAIAARNIAEEQRTRADKERNRAELAEDSIRRQLGVIEKINQDLAFANDSIELQSRTIKKANDNLYDQLAKASSREALSRLDLCDIIGACHIIDDFIQDSGPENSDTKLHPHVRQALHIIYDSLTVAGVRKKPIGIYDVKSKVADVEFSRDGKYLVFATTQGYISLVDIANGFDLKWCGFFFSDISDIDIHPNSNMIGITSDHNGSIVCNLNGNIIAEFDRSQRSKSICFSPDGQYLAIADIHVITIYNCDDFSKLTDLDYDTLECYKHITSIDFNDKSELLIATNRECFLYDWKNNRKLKIFNEFEGGRASFSKDYKSVVQCAGYECNLNVYNINTSENVYSQYIKDDKANHWMSGNILLYSGADGNKPLFIDIPAKDTIIAYNGDGVVSALDVHPSAEYVAVGGYNHKVHVLPIAAYDDSHIGTYNFGSKNSTLSPDQKYCAVFLNNSGVVIYDANNMNNAKAFIPELTGEAICFTPDSKHILCGLKGGAIKEFDLNGELIRVFPDSLPGSVLESMVIRDNFQDIFIGASNHIHKFDYKSGKLVKSAKCNSSVSNIHLNNSGTKLITSHASSPNFKIWDTDLNVELSVLPDLNEIGNDAVFSPDDKMIAVANYNRYIHVIDIEKREGKELIGHSGGVSHLVFIDNNTLASYGSDDMLIIWDIATGLPLHKYKLKNGYATSLTYIPSKQYILAGSLHGTHIYHIPTTNNIITALQQFIVKADL